MAELTMMSNKSLVRIQRNGDMNAIYNDMWLRGKSNEESKCSKYWGNHPPL